MVKQEQLANDVAYAILQVFKDHFSDMANQESGNHIYANKAEMLIDGSVVAANDDNNDWAETAHVIIYHCDGMPKVESIDKWFKVSRMLEKGFYIEPINNEVSAVFSL